MGQTAETSWNHRWTYPIFLALLIVLFLSSDVYSVAPLNPRQD